jgi:acetyltransferase-like isoleucine patch superfamily enzyme
VSSPIITRSMISDVDFGARVRVVMPSNLYGCKLGDDCFVGPFVEIQRGVLVGSRTKIQSHAFLCEMVEIGEDCFISHGVMFINDAFRSGKTANRNIEFWEATKIGDRVLLGTNSTILPVEICNDVVIGAGSVVTKDITKSGLYCGNPARYMGAVHNDKVR